MENHGDIHQSYQQEEVILQNKTCKNFIPVRYTIAILQFWGFFCTLATRGCINVAIVVMVNTTDTNKNQPNGTVDRCPGPEHPDYANDSTSPETQGDVFDWSPDTQSLILGVFYYGYIVCQLPAGLLCSYWKPQHLFGLNVFLSGVLCLMLPFLAHWNTNALIVCRFFMGFAQAPLYSSNIALGAIWAPALERSTILVLTSAGATVANIVSPVVTGYLCKSGFLGGWPSVFYLFGGMSCLWYVFWMLMARYEVSDHPWISRAERQLLVQSVNVPRSKKITCPPWKSFFTSRGFYGVLFQTILDGAGYYVVYSCYPMYMKMVLNYDITEDSLLTAAPHLAALTSSLIAGPSADFIMSRRWLSVTATRKTFAFVGGSVLAMFIVAMGYVNCDRVLAVLFLTLGWLFGGLISVGPYVSILDMSPEHAGVLEGLLNTFNNIGGFLSPMLVEWLTQGQPSRSQWKIVFFITASFHTGGTLAYVVLGTSEEQDWSSSEQSVQPINDDENSPLLA